MPAMLASVTLRWPLLIVSAASGCAFAPWSWREWCPSRTSASNAGGITAKGASPGSLDDSTHSPGRWRGSGARPHNRRRLGCPAPARACRQCCAWQRPAVAKSTDDARLGVIASTVSGSGPIFAISASSDSPPSMPLPASTSTSRTNRPLTAPVGTPHRQPGCSTDHACICSGSRLASWNPCSVNGLLSALHGKTGQPYCSASEITSTMV